MSMASEGEAGWRREDSDGRVPVVGVVMGSDSDWPVMQAAVEVLEEFGVPAAADVVSAHRMPADMISYGQSAASRGLKVIIAGARNAGLLAVRILAVRDPALAARMADFQAELRVTAQAKGEALRAKVHAWR